MRRPAPRRRATSGPSRTPGRGRRAPASDAPASLRLAALLLLLATAGHAVPAAGETAVIGWVEEGIIEPENIKVKMKMDSGALSSSIDAKHIETFARDGAPWVRYRLELKDADTGALKRIDFERPVARSIKVRGAGGVDHRPVVKLEICIGQRIHT